MFGWKSTGSSRYDKVAHNVAAIANRNFEDVVPLRSLHTQERFVWASEIQGMTSPERYTSVAGE